MVGPKPGLPLFHGTRAPLLRGATVMPGDTVGRSNHTDGHSDHVYVTTSIGLAQVYAEVASGRGRPRVLQVEPLGEVIDDELSLLGATSDSYACPAARVIDVFLID